MITLERLELGAGCVRTLDNDCSTIYRYVSQTVEWIERSSHMTHSGFAADWDPRPWMKFSAEGHRHGPGGPRGRHRGRGGFTAPAFGFGGPPWGGGRGRKRRGDVRAAILRLLAEEPRNGYQIMQAIEELSAGRWRPSPGSVYPALSQLEDEGLIRATERDGAKVFELTDAGREQAASIADAPAPWAGDDEDDQDARMQLWQLFKQVVIAVKQVSDAGDENQISRARDVLADTRKSLYRILADEDDE
jgi:DNA-binding PadR family transcriptional regulator